MNLRAIIAWWWVIRNYINQFCKWGLKYIGELARPIHPIFASSGHCLFRQVIVSLIPFHQGFLGFLSLNTTEWPLHGFHYVKGSYKPTATAFLVNEGEFSMKFNLKMSQGSPATICYMQDTGFVFCHWSNLLSTMRIPGPYIFGQNIGKDSRSFSDFIVSLIHQFLCNG